MNEKQPLVAEEWNNLTENVKKLPEHSQLKKKSIFFNLLKQFENIP